MAHHRDVVGIDVCRQNPDAYVVVHQRCCTRANTVAEQRELVGWLKPLAVRAAAR